MTAVDPGQGYRLLQEGEEIRKGDECWTHGEGPWARVLSSTVGLKVGDGRAFADHYPFRRLESPEAAPKAAEAVSYLELTGIKEVQMEENRRLSEEMEAARPADPREAEPTDQKSAIKELWIGYSELRFKPIPFLTAKDAHEWLRNVPRNYGKCSVRHFRQVDARAPESQPHKVHPWDALQALKDQERIRFFVVERFPSSILVTLFYEGSKWIQEEAPTLSEAVQAAVEKLPLGVRP